MLLKPEGQIGAAFSKETLTKLIYRLLSKLLCRNRFKCIQT